jgi:hypothetical protein
MEPSAPVNSSTYRVPPRPWMVAHDNSRIFSNTVDPFDWLTPSTLEKARIKSYLDYILSGCTQNSLVSAKSMANPWQRPHLLLASSIRPSRSYLAYGACSHQERLSTTLRVAALGVVLFFCPTHGNPATMLAFFPNKFRPARSSCG